MANAKITELAELTTPASGDLFGIVDDPAGTPVTKKITIGNLDLNLMDNSSAGFYSSGDTPSFAGATITGTNGIDVNPGSDTDADLITVGVTDSPKFWWDESEDRFGLNKDLEFSAKQVHTKPVVGNKTAGSFTIYVDTSTGSDSNDGSNGSPVATIQKAIDILPDLIAHSITIDIADGTYTEDVDISNKYLVTLSAALILDGNQTTPSNVIIDGESTRAYGIKVTDCTKVQLKGMEINNCGSAGSEAGLQVYSSTVEVTAFKGDSNGRHGAYLNNAALYIFDDCTFDNNSESGIRAYHSYVEYTYDTGASPSMSGNNSNVFILGSVATINGDSTDYIDATENTWGMDFDRGSSGILQYIDVGDSTGGSRGIHAGLGSSVYVNFFDESTGGNGTTLVANRSGKIRYNNDQTGGSFDTSTDGWTTSEINS